MVTGLRIPCFKLAAKFKRKDMVKRFLQSRRSGFYLRVTREGEAGAGEQIESLGQDAARVSIAEFLAIYVGQVADPAAFRRIMAVEALPESWREFFQNKLSLAEG